MRTYVFQLIFLRNLADSCFILYVAIIAFLLLCVLDN